MDDRVRNLIELAQSGDEAAKGIIIKENLIIQIKQKIQIMQI